MKPSDGVPTEDLLTFHEAHANGGVGLTTVAYGAVRSDGRSFRTQLLMCEEAIPQLRELTRRVKEAGGASMIQLTHAGSLRTAQ